MSRIRCWQVDAFAARPFTGNPAAVCWLEAPADAAWMQSVASEMNLSETAFVRRLAEGYELRWFTPAAEVELCGHATLATAHVLWTSGVASSDAPLRFQTRSGWLTCAQVDGLIELDFPMLPAKKISPPPGLLEALGVEAEFVGQTKYDLLLALASEQAVRACRPDFRRLREIRTRGILITARSDDPQHDFVSRSFFPAIGVDEDPVCGSAHCSLGPYWSEQLGKTQLSGQQISQRGGVVRVRLAGDRAFLGGHAVTVWEGALTADAQPLQTGGLDPTALAAAGERARS